MSYPPDVKKSGSEYPVESPIPFKTGSNGEFEPLAPTKRDRVADETFHRLAAEKGYDPAFGARPVKRVIVVGVNISVSTTRLRKSGTNRTAASVMRSYHRSFSSW